MRLNQMSPRTNSLRIGLLIVSLVPSAAMGAEEPLWNFPEEYVIPRDPDLDADSAIPGPFRQNLSPIGIMYQFAIPKLVRGTTNQFDSAELVFAKGSPYTRVSSELLPHGDLTTTASDVRVGYRFPIVQTLYEVVDIESSGVRVRRAVAPELQARLGNSRCFATCTTLFFGADHISIVHRSRKMPYQNLDSPWTCYIGGVDKKRLSPEDALRFREEIKVALNDEIVVPTHQATIGIEVKEKRSWVYQQVSIPERRFKLVDVVPRNEEEKIAGWIVLEVIEPGEPVELSSEVDKYPADMPHQAAVSRSTIPKPRSETPPPLPAPWPKYLLGAILVSASVFVLGGFRRRQHRETFPSTHD